MAVYSSCLYTSIAVTNTLFFNVGQLGYQLNRQQDSICQSCLKIANKDSTQFRQYMSIIIHKEVILM